MRRCALSPMHVFSQIDSCQVEFEQQLPHKRRRAMFSNKLQLVESNLAGLQLNPHVVLNFMTETNSVHAESNFAKLYRINDATAIENNGRFTHHIVHL